MAPPWADSAAPDSCALPETFFLGARLGAAAGQVPPLMVNFGGRAVSAPVDECKPAAVMSASDEPPDWAAGAAGYGVRPTWRDREVV